MLISCSPLRDNGADAVDGRSQLPPVITVENAMPELATETVHEPNKDSTHVLVSPSGGQSQELSAEDTIAVPGAADIKIITFDEVHKGNKTPKETHSGNLVLL